MAVDNSRRNTTPPRPNLPPEGQPWGRWVTDTLNDLKLETGGVKREVISSNKNHNAQLQMSAQQKREIVKVNLKAEEALNIALAASGSTTIYFVAPETPEQGDIWYENVTGIWFRWVDDQWVPITDETLLEALEAILAQRIANDDKIRTFAQPDAPTGLTAEHVGDLWYDTDDKNKLYRWDGLQWVPIRDAGITEAQDAADAAQGTADDAKTVADDAKETADTAADTVTQLEAQVTADLGDMQGRLVTAEGELEELENVTLPALNTNLGALDTALTDLQTDVDNLVIPSVDGLNKITYSTSAPSATAGYKEGDTWFRYTGTGASRVIYGQWHFTGSAWNVVALRNEMIASLDAGKVTTGFLDAGRIEANSLTAEKLLVGGGDNLLPDPKMRVPESWGSGSLVQLTGGRSGAGQVVIPAGASTNGTYQSTSDTDRTRMTPVTAGETYYVEAWVRGAVTINAGRYSARIYLRAYPEGVGDYTWPTPSYLTPSESIPANTWGLISGQVTIPEGQSYLSVGLYSQTQYVAEMRWSDPVVRKAVSATLIENGAVTTEKVAAEAITGAKIKAGSITASDAIFANAAIKAADIASINADTITVGTLSAIDISGVTISGSEITGGTITGQTTVTSGGTLLVNGGKIRVQDEDDHLVFETFDWGISIGNASTPDIKTQLGTFFVDSDPDNPIVELRTRKRIAGNSWDWGDSIALGYPMDSAIIGAPRRTAGFVAKNASLVGNYPGDPVPGTQIFTDVAVVGDILLSPNRKIRARHIESSGPRSYVTVTGGLQVDGGDLTVNGNISGTYGDGAEETGRFFGRQFGGATRSSDQNLSTTSTTTIVLNSTSGFSSRGVSLSGGGLTVAHGGYYVVEAAVQFDGSGSSYWRNLLVQVNGSTRRSQPSIASGNSRMASSTAAFELDAGDKVTLATNSSYNSTGMSVNANVFLTITRVGA